MNKPILIPKSGPSYDVVYKNGFRYDIRSGTVIISSPIPVYVMNGRGLNFIWLS